MRSSMPSIHSDGVIDDPDESDELDDASVGWAGRFGGGGGGAIFAWAAATSLGVKTESKLVVDADDEPGW